VKIITFKLLLLPKRDNFHPITLGSLLFGILIHNTFITFLDHAVTHLLHSPICNCSWQIVEIDCNYTERRSLNEMKTPTK